MHLKLRHLQVFHAILEEGSVTKAATRMGISQPAISVALSTLEELLGYTLFHRSKGYFSPTPEAYLLQADADLAILAFEQFANRGRLIGHGNVGLIRIGTIGTTTANLMPEIISDFTRENEQVEIQLQVRSSSQIAYLVSNAQMDIGIVESPAAAPNISSTDISIPCVCILHKNDPLAAEQIITPVMLKNRKLLSVYEGHSVDRQINDAFNAAGIDRQSNVHCYFFSIMRKLVSENNGIAIVDALNGCFNANDNIVWRRFEPKINYDLAIITKAKTSQLLPILKFVESTHKKLIDAIPPTLMINSES